MIRYSKFIKYFFFLLPLMGLMSCAEKRQPNVILILTDDQGWGDLSLHGNPSVQTPHMDQLAKEGVRFERFYVNPLCAPTRASILTGKYALRTGVVSVSKSFEVMNEGETTIADIFRDNGYKTGIFGKWHNGEHYPYHPLARGFDEFFGFCAGHWPNYFNTILEHNGKQVKTEGYITDVLTNQALDFIDRNKDKPFFCYIPYNAPHAPHQAPDVNFNHFKEMGLSDELSAIYGMVENADENIGRISAYLKANNLDENTIVIFVTDNGPNGIRYNGNMKGIKGSVNEGGVRVPCFFRWKGKIRPDRTISTLAADIDILPTLIGLCGLQVKSLPDFDGINLSEQILSDRDTAMQRTLFSYVNFMNPEINLFPGAVRTNQYRLIVGKENAELYDMSKDPGQTQDIADAFPSLKDSLMARYKTWFTRATQNISLNRPIPLQAGEIKLPASASQFSGSLKFKEGHGWTHDWIINWTNLSDSIWWDVSSEEEQSFEVSVEYVRADLSEAQIQISTTLSDASGFLKGGTDTVMIVSPDRIPRKEVYERKQWAEGKLGIVSVPKGQSRVVIRALQTGNGTVAELNAAVLRMQ